MTNDNDVYDDANRLTSVNGVAYTWDNNGNLLNDGTNTYTYDSANRLKTLTNASTTASYAYSGLGDRLRETVNGNPTTFTMDLNAGLTQALSDGTKAYIYGNGRIAQATGTSTEYFLGDALGSVRQMTSTSGAITHARAYDPYGVVTSTSGSSQSAYAFTGEYYGDSTQLLYLRARMYAPNRGRFLTRDPWPGVANRPLSFNGWNYVEANPINLTDPTGKFPEWCRSYFFKWLYAKCVLDYYDLEAAGSIFFNGDAVTEVKGSSGCWSGPIQYRAMGYLEGYSWFVGPVWGGKEIVYDFATMERSEFTYIGGGLSDSILGAGGALYVGLADGLRSDRILPEHYMGLALVKSVGADISTPIDLTSIGLGGVATTSISDWKLETLSVYVSVSVSVGVPYGDIGLGLVNYTPSGKYRRYQRSELGSMLSDMIIGRYTPLPQNNTQDTQISALYSIRGTVAAVLAPYYFYVYEEMNNERMRSENLSN